MSNQDKLPKPLRAATHPFGVAKRLYNSPQVQNVLRKRTYKLEQQFLHMNHHVKTLQREMAEIKELVDVRDEKIQHRLHQFDNRITDVLHQLTIMNEHLAKGGAPQSTQQTSSEPAKGTAADPALLANEHTLDQFYVQFEHWFRGTEAEIKERQAVYLSYFTTSDIDSQKYPAIDIGCGNGEFVELLHENGIRGIGLDLNKAMIDRVKEKGLEGHQGDALEFLRQQKSNSIMAITGFHIVEHIPFIDLVRLFDECYRVLVPGGFIIFETPNPENLIVGTCSFYNDPSHLHPLPPMFLEFVVKTRGFPKTEIKRLHPIKESTAHSDKLVAEMAERMYGPQDYAVIGQK